MGTSTDKPAVSELTKDAPPETSAPPQPSKTERTRRFLERNKIFFETIAAFLLSLMAILISKSQNDIANKQTELAQVQTEIAKQQAMPQFVVQKVLGYDQATQVYTDESVTIINQGGIAQAFEVDAAVFFKVSVTRIGEGQKILTLPVNGYYVADILTGAGTGLLATVKGVKNNDRYANLERDFIKLAEERNLFADITLQRYVSLQYQDIFGESHTKYFQINHIGGSTPVDNGTGAALFKQYMSAYTDGMMVQFEQLTPETLLEKAL